MIPSVLNQGAWLVHFLGLVEFCLIQNKTKLLSFVLFWGNGIVFYDKKNPKQQFSWDEPFHDNIWPWETTTSLFMLYMSPHVCLIHIRHSINLLHEISSWNYLLSQGHWKSPGCTDDSQIKFLFSSQALGLHQVYAMGMQHPRTLNSPVLTWLYWFSKLVSAMSEQQFLMLSPLNVLTDHLSRCKNKAAKLGLLQLFSFYLEKKYLFFVSSLFKFYNWLSKQH